MNRLFQLLSAISEAREAAMSHRAEPKPDNEEWRAKDAALAKAVREAEAAYRTAEAEYREAGTDPQFRRLQDSIECRQYLQAAIDTREVQGAEAEFNRELSLPGNVMPWEALEPRQARQPGEEHRADDATTIPDAVAGSPQEETLRRVFETGNVGFLGIREPMVAFGEPNFPVMADVTAARASQPGAAGARGYAPGGAVEADALTFNRVTVEPHRLSARYLMRMEDMARFPSLEDMLRSDLRMVMTELRDRQVLMGGLRYKPVGTAALTANDVQNDIVGVFQSLQAAGALDAKAEPQIAAAATWALMEPLLYEAIDGRYASMASDIRWLFGVDTIKKLHQLRYGTEEVITFPDYLMRRNIQYRVSAYIPYEENYGGEAASVGATAGDPDNVQRIIRTSRGMDAVAPVWQGITLIRDPYSGAAKAELAITAHALHGFAFLRTAAWHSHAVKVA